MGNFLVCYATTQRGACAMRKKAFCYQPANGREHTECGGKRGLRMFSRAALANFLTKRETTSAKRKRTLSELPDGFEKQLDDLNSAVSLVYELLGIIEKAQETGRVDCDLDALRHKAQRLGIP